MVYRMSYYLWVTTTCQRYKKVEAKSNNRNGQKRFNIFTFQNEKIWLGHALKLHHFE